MRDAVGAAANLAHSFAPAEWTHVIAQHVFRRSISAREAQQVYRDFERDREGHVWTEGVLSE